MSKKPKVLFIAKNRETYSECEATPTHYSHEMTSGLYNSAKFISNMLVSHGIESNVIAVVDNNCIDKAVHEYKPTHVFIEALWVVPAKLELLAQMYPKVNWIVRIHSNTPFIAMEGVAMEWILEYVGSSLPNIFVAPNTVDFLIDLELDTNNDDNKIIYLPNYYNLAHHKAHTNFESSEIHIGCFGAIRPLKNQLIQALAAIGFANQIGKELFFHINSNRLEQKGDSVYKNIKALFGEHSPHTLVEHDWQPHLDFLELIESMDINMQVSLTETFNIVTADSVARHVPVVVSKEIVWIDKNFQARPTSSLDIIEKLMFVYEQSIKHRNFLDCNFSSKLWIVRKNYKSLEQWNKKAVKQWLNYLK